MLYNIGIFLIVAVSFLLLLDMYRSFVLRRGNWEKKDSIEHEWEFKYKGFDSKSHREYNLYQCKACFDYKRTFTGSIYQKKFEKHSCNFCESPETTEYPAEGSGTVWLCEDCKSIGSGESADR